MAAKFILARVSVLPAVLVANTIYFVSAAANELEIVTVGTVITDVRSTKVAAGRATEINTALSGFRLADSAGLTSDVASAISTAISAIGLASSATLESDVAAKIATEIGKLDQSNTALIAANIAARDALVLTKSSFVVVADATGDPTVAAGAAMYFYNVGDDSYMKIAEYESMDFVIPNKAILEKLSIINGNLAYDGAEIGTVQAGAQEW